MSETIKVNVRVCECGARYATPGVAQRHRCPQNGGGKGTFRTVKETRPKPESRISYQPGYGPHAVGSAFPIHAVGCAVPISGTDPVRISTRHTEKRETT